MSEMRLEEDEELPRVSLVGLTRRGALSALCDEMRKPCLDDPFEIAAKRQLGVRRQNFIERLRHRPHRLKPQPFPGLVNDFVNAISKQFAGIQYAFGIEGMLDRAHHGESRRPIYNA